MLGFTLVLPCDQLIEHLQASIAPSVKRDNCLSWVCQGASAWEAEPDS